jgi:pSer/pThr/pTyr-binding forkhead associated (FHA) protein
MVHYYHAVATGIIDVMSSPYSDPLSEGDGLPPVGFNSQGPMGLAEILQMCCSEHRSGQITFRTGESSGYVYLQHGRVLHAVCGGTEGEEAIYRMLGWPSGGFALDEGILPHRRTVKLTWEQLLFEGARRADANGQPRPQTGPIITAEPVTSSRTTDSLPKLTVILPDQRPIVYLIEAEYTHVGRASGNEIPLSYPSVSNRHCMFILSGSDIVLRDLNSSNGTVVNGQTISEVILRPGDLIQVGVVQIKFEPGVRRPKLTQTGPSAGTPSFGGGSELREVYSSGTVSGTTLKLPNARPAPSPSPRTEPIADDSAFVKGEAPISYENLPKPEIPGRPRPVMLIVTILILILALAGGGYYYYFIFLRH